MEAAKSGTLPKAQEACTNGANVECKDKEGNTALSLAVTNGYRLLIDWLINEKGANVNTKNNVSSHVPGHGKQFQRKRLGSSAVPQPPGRQSRLIARRHKSSVPGGTALLSATMACPHFHALFSRPKSPLFCDRQDGCTPLMYAASVGHIDILKFLMEKGCDLEAKNEDGFTALHWAAYVGNLDSCKTLIEKGANLKAKNSEGKKPADLAETQEVKKFIKDAIEKQKKAGDGEAPPAQ